MKKTLLAVLAASVATFALEIPSKDGLKAAAAASKDSVKTSATAAKDSAKTSAAAAKDSAKSSAKKAEAKVEKKVAPAVNTGKAVEKTAGAVSDSLKK